MFTKEYFITHLIYFDQNKLKAQTKRVQSYSNIIWVILPTSWQWPMGFEPINLIFFLIKLFPLEYDHLL